MANIDEASLHDWLASHNPELLYDYYNFYKTDNSYCITLRDFVTEFYSNIWDEFVKEGDDNA